MPVAIYLHLLLTGLIISVTASFTSEHLFLKICHLESTLSPKILLDILVTVSSDALLILSRSMTLLIPPKTFPIPCPI